MKSMPPRTTELESEPADCIAAQKISPLLLSDGLFFSFFLIQKKRAGQTMTHRRAMAITSSKMATSHTCHNADEAVVKKKNKKKKREGGREAKAKARLPQ